MRKSGARCQYSASRPAFSGKVHSPDDAYALINKGKMTLQSRNCMECHQILGNGAYYAPDLTRAWIDPWWEDRLMAMVGAATGWLARRRWRRCNSVMSYNISTIPLAPCVAVGLGSIASGEARRR